MKHDTEDSSQWPWASMLWCGTFGRSTPEGKRYHRRAFGAMGALAIAVVAAVAADERGLPGRWIAVIAAPSALAYIFFEFYRYLRALDELARRVQLEAVLFAYAVVLIACIAAGAAEFHVNLLWVFVAAEPLRGLGLVVAARRYR